MKKQWELRLNENEFAEFQNKCNFLNKQIQHRLNEKLDDNFVIYIQNLVDEQLVLHQQKQGLVYRLNEILRKQDNECQSLQEKFTRRQIFTILIMMYFNLIESNFNQRGFYQTNMDEMIYSKYQKAQEKHKCFLHYFRIFYQRFRNREEEEVVFIRENSKIEEIINQIPNDSVNSQQFSVTQALIEQIESDNVIVDFADKNVAGLVLDGGNCAQEEIMLLCYPEGVISTLIMTPMQKNEGIFIQNVIRYNYYSGYESSFTHDAQQRQQVITHHILMIDAQPYFNQYIQYSQDEKMREILKCYAGFKIALHNLKDKNITISTGKWGCGIFKGNLELKFLLQLYGFCLAKQKLQLNNQSHIRFSAFNDQRYEKLILKYQKRLENIKLSELKEIIDKFNPE